MFAKQCLKNKKAIYGIKGASVVNSTQTNFTNGTAFMIAPGYLMTVAHVVHIENDINKAVHSHFEVINAEDIGQKMEKAVFVAEDTIRDVAILKIENAKHTDCLVFDNQIISMGTPCGSLGFPLSGIIIDAQKRVNFNLTLRFQGSNLSSFNTVNESGRKMSYYETDALMYRGSSGCPCFTENGKVFGMQSRTAADQDQPGSLKSEASRLSISILVPSEDMIKFAEKNIPGFHN